jgi:hypothetical protein
MLRALSRGPKRNEDACNGISIIVGSYG